MIALLDGPQVDDGTVWEIGDFYARECEGRRSECDDGGGCDRIVRSRVEVLDCFRQLNPIFWRTR